MASFESTIQQTPKMFDNSTSKPVRGGLDPKNEMRFLKFSHLIPVDIRRGDHY